MSEPKKKTAKKRSKRAPSKQGVIPGTKPKRDRKLEELADEYVDARDQRMAFGEDEKKAKEALISYCKAKGITAYNDGEFEVVLTVKDPTDQVKVKRLDDNSEGAAE